MNLNFFLDRQFMQKYNPEIERNLGNYIQWLTHLVTFMYIPMETLRLNKNRFPEFVFRRGMPRLTNNSLTCIFTK